MLCRFAGNQGRADSLGRTVLAAIAYYEEQLLDNILQNCIIGFYPLKVLRHPDVKKGISRDHITYLLVGLKYFQQNQLLSYVVDSLRWKISDFARFTPDMWLWAKGLPMDSVGSRLARWLFYRIEIPWMRLMYLWNKIIRFIAGFKPERDQLEFDCQKLNQGLNPIQKWFRKKMYPAYTLAILGWQLYVLPDSRLKRRLQRVCLRMVGGYNYLIRLLFGDYTVTFDDVQNYKHMTAWRWGVNLDETNDRTVYIVTDPKLIEDNTLETDLLQTVMSQTISEIMNNRI